MPVHVSTVIVNEGTMVDTLGDRRFQALVKNVHLSGGVVLGVCAGTGCRLTQPAII